jgi:hypothetical protein
MIHCLQHWPTKVAVVGIRARHKFALQLCSLENSVVLTHCSIYGHYLISSSYHMKKRAKKLQLKRVTTHVQVNIHTQ